MINFILNTKSKYVIMYANNIGGKAMKKIICRREYDTDTATLVKKYTEGEFGEAEGFEESLYQTEKGLFFLYVNGGENSPYKKEDIKCVSKAKAEEWLKPTNRRRCLTAQTREQNAVPKGTAFFFSIFLF